MGDHISMAQIDRIRAAGREIVRELGFMKPTLARTNLSASAVHTLIEVGYGTVNTAADLKQLLKLEKSSMSRILKKLEDQDLIVVRSDGADKRKRLLHLTDQGVELLRQIENYGRGQLLDAFEHVPSDKLKAIERGLCYYSDVLGAVPTSSRQSLKDFDIRKGYQPGLIAYMTALHVRYYSQHHGFGLVFERQVADGLGAFFSQADPSRCLTLSAFRRGECVASIVIDGSCGDPSQNMAQLRWFIVAEDAHGRGLGRRLLQDALTFGDQCGFDAIQLWTFKGLDAARALYERAGFKLMEEKKGNRWGPQVVEQRFVRQRPGQ